MSVPSLVSPAVLTVWMDITACSPTNHPTNASSHNPIALILPHLHFAQSLCWLYQVMLAMELENDQGIGADLGNNPKFFQTKKAFGQMTQYQNSCPSTALASGCQFSLFQPCFLEQAKWNDSVHSSVCSA